MISGSAVGFGPRAGSVLHLVVGVRMALRLSVVLAIQESRRVPRFTVAVNVTVILSGGEGKELGLRLRIA